jgi:hypothetical protein
MSDTVREGIRAAIKSMLEGDANNGVVHAPGARTPFSLTDEAGKATVELAVLDDVTNSELASHNLEAFDFEVIAVAHMPDEEPDYQAYANLWYGGTAEKLASVSAPGLIRVDVIGGGGVTISDIGTVVTACAATFTYRHKRGDPWVVS